MNRLPSLCADISMTPSDGKPTPFGTKVSCIAGVEVPWTWGLCCTAADVLHVSDLGLLCTPLAQMYKYWTVVSTDFLEEDARAYVRMNWKDMTPKTVAQGLRSCNPKWTSLTDEQFEALYYRCTVEEYFEKKAAFLEQEKIDEAAAAEKEKQDKERIAALEAEMAAEGA